uniref:RHS repeat protein n=1 Tax=candidate division WOR-3 bacterium TaxID=2052148 RepID=A0A7V0Z5A7_UNCW3
MIPGWAGHVDPFYDFRGQNSFRESEPLLPEERFDPYTGNITLVYTDVYLPRDGGLDLKIMRVYNSAIRRYYDGTRVYVPDSWVGLGWSLHMGKLVDPPAMNDYKYIEMPDGSKHTFYSHPDNPGLKWISKEYWILHDRGDFYELLFTNGTKWVFFKNIVGRIPEPAGPYDYYPTQQIIDPSGNVINIFYQVINNQTLIQRIEEASNRIIYFHYDTGGMMNLNSIEIYPENKFYRYYYQDIGGGYSLLKKVQLPGDPTNYYSYQYNYTSGGLTPNEIYEVYNPWGGKVTYSFTTRTIQGRNYRVMGQRTVSAPGGTWSIAYSVISSPEGYLDSTTVTDPYGTKTSFIMYGYPYNPTPGNYWKLGLT